MDSREKHISWSVKQSKINVLYLSHSTRHGGTSPQSLHTQPENKILTIIIT
jgi:hypothetical protein